VLWNILLASILTLRMIRHCLFAIAVLVLALSLAPGTPASAAAGTKTFKVKGVVQEVKPDGKTVVIDHERIPNYMDSMMMPFRVKPTNEVAGLRRGDVVTFRLSVTESESWIDQITNIFSPVAPPTPAASSTNQAPQPTANIVEGLSAYTFLNEFGRPVAFRDYQGQAIALTFFFTRCPIPDYCPRLTRNFLAATKKLESMPNAPTNWHLFSISFDPLDTPEVLRAYAKGYGYDSNHWSFLTASPQTISAVTRNFGFNFKNEGGTFSHEFLTVILNASGYWQAAWPIGGDTSDVLVDELTKAAAVTRRGKENP
jgi:protein SCO1